MRFEWDEDKNRSNFKKHGIWFEEARPFGLIPNPSSFWIRNIVPVKIVSFESGIRREVEFFSSYFASGRRDQRFVLSLLGEQPRER